MRTVPYAFAEHSSREIADVFSRAVIGPRECAKRTTGNTGSMVARPVSKTAFCCAKRTIGTYTTPVGTSSSTTVMSN